MLSGNRTGLERALALERDSAVDGVPNIMRVLAPREPAFPELSGSLEFVRDPREPFDVMYLDEPCVPAVFERFVDACANPVAPLIALDSSYGERADVQLRRAGPSDLAHAVAEVSPIVRKLVSLPPAPRGEERGAYLALAMAWSRGDPVRAGWSPGSREVLAYDRLLGVAEQRRLLEALADQGLLKRTYFERLHTCGACSSSRVFAREVCSRCGSSDLAEHQLLHHYTCGMQAPEPLFLRGDGYECPKCRKPFHHYGVDYDRPGQVISCSACDATISEPDVYFVCADCGEQTDSEQAAVVCWFHYQITSQGRAALESGVLPAIERSGAEALPVNHLQDFRVMVQNYVHIAERESRPLTMVRFDLLAEPGHSLARGLRQLYTLVGETARKGDIVAMADGTVLACLPETDTERAQPLLARVDGLVSEQLADGFEVSPQVIARDHVLSTLKALC